MSAARATTLGSRTSGCNPTRNRLAAGPRPLPRRRCSVPRRPVSKVAIDLAAALHRTLAIDGPMDLRAILGPLARGAGDPTMRVASGAAIRASVTAAGPASIELRVVGGEIRAWAWGPGAEVLLDGLPALLGQDDDDAGFEPGLHPVVAVARAPAGPRTAGPHGRGLGGAPARPSWSSGSPARRRGATTAGWCEPTEHPHRVRSGCCSRRRRRRSWRGSRSDDLIALGHRAAPGARPAQGRAGGTALRGPGRCGSPARRRRAGSDESRHRVARDAGNRAVDRRRGDAPGPRRPGCGQHRRLPTCRMSSDSRSPGQPRGTDEEMLELLAPWAGPSSPRRSPARAGRSRTAAARPPRRAAGPRPAT